MNDTRQCQYVVMFGKMGFGGLEWSAVDRHYDSLESAEADAKKYGQWQILELSATVVKTSKESK
jgi:hypothetical protein